ncbi:hypothetical protein DVH05_000684 [Phytophthora capsici]|nr:hypothetical protein DVH05_000684 [Phytophthora capsici]
MRALMVRDTMAKPSWSLSPLQHPTSVHLYVTVRHIGKAAKFTNALKEAVQEVKEDPNPSPEGGSAIYGMASSLPAGPVHELLRIYTDITLLETFDMDGSTQEGKVWDQWQGYYHNMSASIAADKAFEDLICNVWHLEGRSKLDTDAEFSQGGKILILMATSTRTSGLRLFKSRSCRAGEGEQTISSGE